MARSKLFLHHPFHITAHSIHRDWWGLPMIEAWDLFSRYLYMITLSFGVRIHAFVLMNNHFHLLMTAPNLNIHQALTFFMQEMEQMISAQAEQAGPAFDGPYHCTEIKSRAYYEIAYKYVYRNPVDARICNRVENYPYSTLRGFLGKDSLTFPAFDNLNLISNPTRQLSWLNSPYPEMEFIQEIHQALEKDSYRNILNLSLEQTLRH